MWREFSVCVQVCFDSLHNEPASWATRWLAPCFLSSHLSHGWRLLLFLYSGWQDHLPGVRNSLRACVLCCFNLIPQIHVFLLTWKRGQFKLQTMQSDNLAGRCWRSKAVVVSWNLGQAPFYYQLAVMAVKCDHPVALCTSGLWPCSCVQEKVPRAMSGQWVYVLRVVISELKVYGSSRSSTAAATTTITIVTTTTTTLNCKFGSSNFWNKSLR